MPRIRHLFVSLRFVFGNPSSGCSLAPWLVRVIMFAMLAVLAPSTLAPAFGACPYCPPTDETLSQKLAQSDEACIVKFVSAKNGAALAMQTTTFQISRVMKPSKFKIDSEIVIPIGVTAQPGDTYLLMGKMVQCEMEWGLPIEIDEDSSEYIRQAPSPEFKPEDERLKYFLNFLDVKNPRISNDAFGEFSRADFKDVESLVGIVSPGKKLREKVRRWLEDPNPQLIVRRAFYGMLLGLCGNGDDAEYLKRQILAPIDPEKNRIGIEGLMGGYLILAGEPGLQLLVEKKIEALPKELSPNDPAVNDLIVDANGLRFTISFLWDYRHNQFKEESLRSAMRKFLDRPDFAETAVIDLARWKDWKSLDQLINAYGKDPWETRSGKEKIVAFALSCRKDAANAKGDAFAQAEKAQKFLDGLDQNFVQSVKRSSSGPIAVPEEKKK